MYNELTVFLKNGSTLKFESITELSFDLLDNSVNFCYVSMSTGKKKRAKLLVNNIAMYAFEV